MAGPTRSERPNILLVMPDQHRPDWVGVRGEVPVRTPTLDRLIERGIGFRNAVCPSPLCGPSRACLASGLAYDRCGVRDHSADYPLAAPTLYGRLRDAGYHVLGTGKFDLQKHSGQQGLDGKRDLAANGFTDGINNAGKWDGFGKGADGTPGDPYTQYLHDHDLLETHIEDFERRRDPDVAYHDGLDVAATFPTALPEHAYCDNFVGRNSVDLLEAAPRDQPWFLQVNFAGPHNPWDVTEAMHGWYRDPDVTFPAPVNAAGEHSAAKHQAIRRNYAAMVENIDRWLERFLEVVAERGEREETLVVFAADHGEMLGDHGLWYKQVPYQASVGIPMVLAGPGIVDRGLVETPATLLDLHATFLEFAGIDPTAVDATMDSVSMRPYLAGETAMDDSLTDGGPRDVVTAGYGPWRLAFDGRYKLVKGFAPAVGVHDFDAWDEAAVGDVLEDTKPVLFDLETDRHERENVAGDHPDVVQRLTRKIDARRTG